jgi:hypothetical protein
MSLTIPNKKYNRNIIVDEKVVYVVFDIKDGINQVKNLNLPFVPDELEVMSFSVSTNNRNFQTKYPAITCDFIQYNQILAVYNLRFPNNQVVPKPKQRFLCKFQKDEYGKKATFNLKYLTKNGLENTDFTQGIYYISLYFVKYKRTKFLKKPREPKYIYHLNVYNDDHTELLMVKVFNKVKDIANELNTHRKAIYLIMNGDYKNKYKNYEILKIKND